MKTLLLGFLAIGLATGCGGIRAVSPSEQQTSDNKFSPEDGDLKGDVRNFSGLWTGTCEVDGSRRRIDRCRLTTYLIQTSSLLSLRINVEVDGTPDEIEFPEWRVFGNTLIENGKAIGNIGSGGFKVTLGENAVVSLRRIDSRKVAILIKNPDPENRFTVRANLERD